MANPVYCGKNDVTVDSIKTKFSCNNETACEIMDVCESGYSFGIQGYWPDQEFSSDADFVYGTGGLIQKLEFLLEIDDGSIFDMFQEAHSTGLQDAGHIEDVA